MQHKYCCFELEQIMNLKFVSEIDGIGEVSYILYFGNDVKYFLQKFLVFFSVVHIRNFLVFFDNWTARTTSLDLKNWGFFSWFDNEMRKGKSSSNNVVTEVVECWASSLYIDCIVKFCKTLEKSLEWRDGKRWSSRCITSITSYGEWKCELYTFIRNCQLTCGCDIMGDWSSEPFSPS